MVQAAYQLLLEQGLETTTMQAVADRADVAVQTVYYTFKTKALLLAEVESYAVLGDRPSTEWRETTLAARLEAATTVEALIKAFVTADTEIKSRLAPFIAAVGPALPSDPESLDRRQRGRQEFFRLFIARLADLKRLRHGMTVDHALEILLAINSLPVFIELTTRRGWTTRQWQSWISYTIETQFY